MHTSPLTLISLTLAVSCLVLSACVEDTRPTDTGTPMDSGLAEDSATGDAAADAIVDAATDAVSGAGCSFNTDCVAAERCECDEATGCFCSPGARGTGINGVDECATGNDCASAVCVEGPSDGPVVDPLVYYCSGPCVTDDDCMGMLPMCLEVTFVGRICVRNPPTP